MSKKGKEIDAGKTSEVSFAGYFAVHQWLNDFKSY